jgi:hypothetical protein
MINWQTPRISPKVALVAGGTISIVSFGVCMYAVAEDEPFTFFAGTIAAVLSGIPAASSYTSIRSFSKPSSDESVLKQESLLKENPEFPIREE